MLLQVKDLYRAFKGDCPTGIIDETKFKEVGMGIFNRPLCTVDKRMNLTHMKSNMFVFVFLQTHEKQHCLCVFTVQVYQSLFPLGESAKYAHLVFKSIDRDNTGDDSCDGGGDDGYEDDDDYDGDGGDYDDYGDDDSKSPGGITFGDFMDFLSVLSKGSQRDKVRYLIVDNYLCFTKKILTWISNRYLKNEAHCEKEIYIKEICRCTKLLGRLDLVLLAEERESFDRATSCL